MKIAPVLAVSFCALAATVLVEPASAAALSGPVSNYFEANTVLSMLASLVAATGMLAANLLSHRRQPHPLRVGAGLNSKRASIRFDA
jgi:hypothetical protein